MATKRKLVSCKRDSCEEKNLRTINLEVFFLKLSGLTNVLKVNLVNLKHKYIFGQGIGCH